MSWAKETPQIWVAHVTNESFGSMPSTATHCAVIDEWLLLRLLFVVVVVVMSPYVHGLLQL